MTQALFTLARVYDAGHIAICKNYASAKHGKSHEVGWLTDPCVDVSQLTEAILEDKQKIQDDIELTSSDEHSNILRAKWAPVASMSFDHLPVLRDFVQFAPRRSISG